MFAEGHCKEPLRKWLAQRLKNRQIDVIKKNIPEQQIDDKISKNGICVYPNGKYLKSEQTSRSVVFIFL